MAKCMWKQFPIDDIGSYKDGHLDEWTKEIVYRQGGDGGAEEGEEGGVEEREEEHVMSQIDEIGGIADNRWEATGCGGEDP